MFWVVFMQIYKRKIDLFKFSLQYELKYIHTCEACHIFFILWFMCLCISPVHYRAVSVWTPVRTPVSLWPRLRRGCCGSDRELQNTPSPFHFTGGKSIWPRVLFTCRISSEEWGSRWRLTSSWHDYTDILKVPRGCVSCKAASENESLTGCKNHLQA